jgi:hypothetical protein
MKRVFLIGVIIYAAASLILSHWPSMAANTGAQSAPWLAMMVVDIAFAGFSAFKLVGPAFFEDEDDEDSIDPNDFSVPDSWFYGLFGLDLLANAGWHGYQAVMLQDLASVYHSVWFIVEVVALFLTFLFFKHAQKVARRLARAAKLAAKAAPAV